MRDGCPFCDYAGPSPILADYPIGRGVLIFEPLRPIVPGHVLVVPKRHAADFADSPVAAADAMAAASYYTRWAEIEDANLITSRGPSATQTVRHVHLHIIPRQWGDGVTLPWHNPNARPARRYRATFRWPGLTGAGVATRMAANETEATAIFEADYPGYIIEGVRPMFEKVTP